jgi:hypothetical protein
MINPLFKVLLPSQPEFQLHHLENVLFAWHFKNIEELHPLNYAN